MHLRKSLMISAAAVALTMSATSASAADAYASLFGGVSFLEKPGLKGASHTHSTTFAFKSTQWIDTSFKTGFVVGGNFGVDWGNIRTELELAARQHDSSARAHVTTSYGAGYVTKGTFSNYTQSRNDSEPVDLSLRAYSLMANVWYDFHGLELPRGITPYVGGGIGAAEVQMDGRINGAKINETNHVVFAWQLGGGLNMPVGESTSLFVDYRYFAADSADLRVRPGFHGGDIRADFDEHNVLIGLRWKL